MYEMHEDILILVTATLYNYVLTPPLARGISGKRIKRFAMNNNKMFLKFTIPKTNLEVKNNIALVII